MVWRLDRRAIQEEFRKLGVALMIAATVGGFFEDRISLSGALTGVLLGFLILIGASVYREEKR